MTFKLFGLLLLATGSALATNLPLTPALRQQIGSAAKAFTGRPCSENYIAKRKQVPNAELARLYVQSGQQVTRQPGFKISREALSPDGLTYKFFGSSAGRGTFMLTSYSAAGASIYYYICDLK